MKFAEFITKLKHRLSESLPGALAHEQFRAVALGNLQPNFNHLTPPRPGSVLILLYEQEGLVKFPLIKRHDYVGTHGGQVCLPGGKAEPGEDVMETALREAEEEIGVNRNTVNVIGRLSDFLVIPSNFKVTPIVGIIDQPQFIPDPYEVKRIFSANLFDLLREEAALQKEIIATGGYRLMAPHFEIDGEVVWGATAMMLNELRVVARELSEDY